ncbi:MAG TPA: DUF362 domain-containing protein [Firmicutes bacterium]|nr:DUF362 domain-containing protein [Bacillota bacterium]
MGPANSTVYFASADVDRLEVTASLPAKFERLLARLPLEDIVKDKNVALKMHLGNKLGYTTIHPLFVRILVKALKDAGGNVFVTDSFFAIAGAKDRGYTEEVIGAPIVAATGIFDKYYYTRPVDFQSLKEIQVAGHIHDADALICFSHVKGHGACAYGGACKNIAMGCVTSKTRSDIHSLEGGLTWDASKCEHCEICIRSCRYGANKFNEKGEYEIFFHHCTYCQHCANSCPTGAITIDKTKFKDFQRGMAICTREVLDTFEPGRIFFINMLTNITLLCDCWGFSMRPLVPDVGIMASPDIVAIEKASLDAIKAEKFIEGSLPAGRTLGEGKHLFERIHAKDPFVQIALLKDEGLGNDSYDLVEVE